MAPSEGHEPGLGAGQKYFALGLKFAGGIVLFVAAGYGLDRWLGVLPLFTVVGTLLGAVLSFLSVYRELQADEQAEKQEKLSRKASRP